MGGILHLNRWRGQSMASRPLQCATTSPIDVSSNSSVAPLGDADSRSFARSGAVWSLATVVDDNSTTAAHAHAPLLVQVLGVNARCALSAHLSGKTGRLWEERRYYEHP